MKDADELKSVKPVHWAVSHSFISLTKTRIRAISITARKVEAIKFYLNLARFNFSFLSKYFEPRVDFSSIISLFTIIIF